jgi:integrase
MYTRIRLWKDFKIWFYNYLDNNRSANTKNIHNLSIKYIEKFNKPFLLKEITAEYLLEFKSWMLNRAKANRNKPGVAGRNRNIRAVKTMMRTAEKFKKIDCVQSWQIVEVEKGENINRTVWHTVEELNQILSVTRKDWRCAVLLGCRAGLRKSEISFLYKTDYNPQNHTISITKKDDWQPKTVKSARTIPLTSETEIEILKSIARAPLNSPYIINVSGKRNTNYYLGGKYIALIKEKLPHIKSFMHKLRHTYGTHLAQKGVSLKAISDLMGHTNILQTEKYLHFGQQELKEKVMLLPKLKI